MLAQYRELAGHILCNINIQIVYRTQMGFVASKNPRICGDVCNRSAMLAAGSANRQHSVLRIELFELIDEPLKRIHCGLNRRWRGHVYAGTPQ